MLPQRILYLDDVCLRNLPCNQLLSQASWLERTQEEFAECVAVYERRGHCRIAAFMLDLVDTYFGNRSPKTPATARNHPLEGNNCTVDGIWWFYPEKATILFNHINWKTCASLLCMMISFDAFYAVSGGDNFIMKCKERNEASTN